MSTYDWPASLEPAACTLMLEPNVREFISPYTGSYEVVDLIGERWRMQLSFADALRATAAAQEAFLNRLRGIHLVRAPYFDRPEPLGTMRGTVTLSASAAQGATSLALTGATAAPNMLAGGSFEIDTNADGLSDGWTAFIGGSGDAGRTQTAYRDSAAPVAPHGTYYQVLRIDAVTNGNDSGLIRTARIAVLPGVKYTASITLRTNVSGKAYLLAREYDGSGSQVADNSTSTATASAFQRLSVSFTASSTTATVELMVRGITAATEYIVIDAVQLEPGPAATDYAGYATLKAGDMLQVGTQLFQVAEDVTFNDAGAATVSIVNRVRTALSGGASVTWQRPVGVFRLQGTPRIVHSGGSARLQDVDLVESF